MERKIRLGIAGGGFACAFPFHLHPNCRVVAVAEQRADRRERLRDHYHCDTVYNSLDELLQDANVEAVGIYTPAPLHAKHSIAALRAGKHVLSAVPAAYSLEECRNLIETVQSTGLTYMMAETSYYRQETIQARQWYREGKFGELFYVEGEYWHERLEDLMFEADGSPTWRYGFPPMHYPTHSTAFLTGVTGERLVRVQCLGWGDDAKILKENAYGNPFWNEVGFFQTDRGHPCRIIVGWHVGYPEVERATWFGSDFSYVMGSPIGQPNAVSASRTPQTLPTPDFRDMLPEPLREGSGHGGSHPFLANEFITALVERRRPVIDVYEAVAYTAPGIVAHQSALKGGEPMTIPNFGRA